MSRRGTVLLAVVLLACCCWTLPPARAANYGNAIAIPPEAGKELEGAAADAAATLQRMTGAAFAVGKEYAGPGIWLVRGDSAQAPEDVKQWLADKGREPFVIRSRNADDQLLVVANDDKGLIHGIYFYLEQLGARFYFPNENWTIIPKKPDVTLEIDRQMDPDFEVRDFFGTGGFGAPNAIDPKLEIKARWEQWKRRNRLGGEFRLGGHSGEAFNTAHKEILLQHPEYLAKIDGKHVPWSLTAKLNTANPEVIKLYVDWTVQRLQQSLKADPKLDPRFAYVSVDPSDGGGHCNSEECKQIGNGSPSDQVFHVANLAAKAVAEAVPGAHVNLYGYNQHAMPPSFDLEPNVYVQIIPYAFQTTGLSPEQFIAAWGKKVKRMGIYDYWSIPDWTSDMPSFDYLRTPDRKLKFWRASNIDAFSSESTYSAGAVGITWYLSSRLMWDLKTDQQALLDEFYAQAFESAAPPMRRMLERWAESFKLTSAELGWSYRDLHEAMGLATTPEVRARLADYGRYLEYIRLQLQVGNAPSDQQAAAREALVDYAWDIYPSAMIHSFRMYQLLTRGKENEELRARYASKDGTGWAAVAMPTDEEIVKAIEAGVQAFPPPPFSPRQFSGELVPVPAGAAAASAAAEPTPSAFFVGSTTLVVDAQSGQDTLRLKIGSGDTVRIELDDADGQRLFEKQLEPIGSGLDGFKNPENLLELPIPLPRPGQYRLKLLTAKNSLVHVQPPRDVRLIVQSLRTSKPLRSPRLYFYVPKGLKTLALYMPDSLPEIMEVRFYDSTGEKVQPTTKDARRIYLVDVPAGQDGKIWSINNVVTPNRTLQLLNAPQAFSFFPETLMVPADALQPAPSEAGSNP